MTNEREPLCDGSPLRPGVGALVGDKYRVIARLGEGGMGAVFEAENVLTLKRAALKWLHPRLEASAAGRQRLLREARATSRVRHRNVVDLYDVVVERDAVILVMELLNGELLSHHLARASLSFAQLVQLLLPALEGLAAAHAVGVLHRDIKPANIFLAHVPGRPEPVPKIIDFGISKILTAQHSQLTRSGVALGTPRYVSYEQLRGERELDGRADVYSFGVMLYEALLGRAPYQGSSLGQQAVQFLTTAPPAPSTLRPAVPEALSALVMKSIARDRADRITSLQALIDQLSPFARSELYPDSLPLCRAGALPLPPGAVAPDLSTRPDVHQLELPHATGAVSTDPAQTSRPQPQRSRSRPLRLLAACGGLALAMAVVARERDPWSAQVSGLPAGLGTTKALAIPTDPALQTTAPLGLVVQVSSASADAGALAAPASDQEAPARQMAPLVRRARSLVPSTARAQLSSSQRAQAPARDTDVSAESERLRAGHLTVDEF